MSATISWLHLSDRHTNSPQTGVDAARVLRTLLEDLKRLQQDYGLRPDLVFFTGDLAWGQTGAEGGHRLSQQLAEGHAFLESVRNSFEPPIPQEHTFLIPGNHDINREAVTQQLIEWLDNPRRTADDVNKLIHAGKLEWQHYMARLTEYREFLEKYGYTHLLGDPTRLTFSAVRTAVGRKIGIVGFNSAWSCCRSPEKAKLWVAGHWQVESLSAAVLDTDFTIALVHHPVGWFVEQEANSFWRDGLQSNFDVRLHGHEHESWADIINGKVTISAGACYDRQSKTNGYNFVRLFLNEKRGEVWFRKYDKRGGGGWGPDIIPNLTNNNGVRSLEYLDWLKPDSPPGGSEGGSPTTPSSPGPTTVQSLREAADEVARNLAPALQYISSQPPTGVAQTPSTETTASRVVRSAAGQQLTLTVTLSSAPLAASPLTVLPLDGDLRLKPVLDNIDKLVSTFQLDDAEREVLKTLDDHRNDLSPRERFRLLIKSAHILYCRQEYALAAAKYREAVTYSEPTDVFARYFTAVSMELEGDIAGAQQLTDALYHDHPTFQTPAVVSLLIRTAPRDQAIAALIARFGPTVCEIPEVAYTLARRAADEGAYEDAIRFEELAIKSKPTWTEARSSLAALLIEQQFGKIVWAGHSRPPLTNWKDFSRVQSLLLDALTEVDRGQSPKHVALLRHNLAIVYTAVGRVEDALSQYKQSYALDPTNVELIYRYASMLGRSGRSDEAIELLRSWLQDNDAPEITLLLAQFLASRLASDNRPSRDFTEPIALLLTKHDALSSFDEHLRADWIAVLINLYVEAKDVRAARATLADIPEGWLPSPLRALLNGEIEAADGDNAKARAAGSLAADLVSDSTDPPTIRQIAILLEHLEEFSRAASMWQRLATLTAMGLDEQHLLYCLGRADDRESLIRVGRQLRSNGVYDVKAINNELAALERTSFERLTETLQELLSAPLDLKLKKELRAQLSYTSLFTGNLAALVADPSLLPRVNEVENSRIGRMVTEVLRRGDNPFLSVQYAYELFRRFPDDADAHIAVICSPGLPESELTTWVEPTVVGPGSAVRFREASTGAETWWIIEDLPSPRLVLGEYSSTDPISTAMFGKSVGDTFLIRDSTVQRREGMVVEIVSKYTFRIRDCFANFEIRFPEHQGFIVQINTGTDTQAGIDALFRQIDVNTERQRDLDAIYLNQKVTLAIYARARGESVFKVIHHIVSSPELSLHCNLGTEEERQSAESAFNDAHSVVIDPSAVATLYLLHSTGGLKANVVLDAIGKALLISEHTIADIRSALESLPSRGGMSIGKEGDRYVRHLITAEQATRQRDSLRDFIALLRTKCSVIHAEHPSPENADAYKEMVIALGLAGAESLRIVGSRSDSVLWTDELLCARLGYPKIGLRRIWTKQIIDHFVQAKALPAGVASAVAVFLIRCGYTFVGVAPDSLLLAAHLSEWKAFNQPLKMILEQFGDGNITIESLIRSASGFLSQLWILKRSRKHVDVARGITARLIGEVLKRQDGQIVALSIARIVEKLLSSRDRALAKQWRKAVRSSVQE